jgi:hypothetical protein
MTSAATSPFALHNDFGRTLRTGNGVSAGFSVLVQQELEMR